ncbi:sulfatase [Photobacterium sagamiensis]|uniref:sulfatase family protein n=1 Tax=Photobacterium sagamiensis TaxID=2910241 RepID=UPI003D0F25D1
MKKNVIWYLVDQLRADALGINGDKNARTPNLDNFAKQSVNFNKAVCGFPLCCPSRASLITGKYAHNNGVVGHEYQLAPSHLTIADMFNSAGYDTIYIGKWHLSALLDNKGAERIGTKVIPKDLRGRFKSFIGYENNNSPFDCYVHGHDGDLEIDVYKLPKYETDALTDIAIDKINEHANSGKSQPFFMVISVQPPHDPYIAPAKHLRNFCESELELRPNVPPYEHIVSQARRDLTGYYAALEAIDDNFGRLIDELDKHGLYEDTHIIFLSDHGDMHGSQGMLRKTNPYEESIRVPVIIGGGGRMAEDKHHLCGEDHALINSVDIAPTSLGLCGIEIPEVMEGIDFSANRLDLRKEKNAPSSAYIQSVVPTYHNDSINKPWRGIVTSDGYKYVCFEHSEWLMFNLNDDPYELVNLVHNALFCEKRKELNQQLRDWIEKTDDDFSVPVIDKTDIDYFEETRG